MWCQVYNSVFLRLGWGAEVARHESCGFAVIRAQSESWPRYNTSGLQAELKSGLNPQVLKNRRGRDSESDKE
jgi:hypothetical protein